MAKILYITYDGIMEPLGESQVLGYLEKLSRNHSIWILSFEKQSDLQNVDKFETCKKNVYHNKIKWISLKYHKKPTSIATLLDILYGCIVGLWIVYHHKIKIVHARSYVPSVIALFLKKITRISYIFDMRGFWANERVDGDLWLPDSYLFRISKWFEKHFLINSDVIVSLTHAAVKEINTLPYLINKMPELKVITTCTDLDLFNYSPKLKNSKKTEHPFVVGYVGSVGVWYLFEESLKCFKIIKEIIPNAKLHIINREDHDYIYEHLKRLNVDLDSVLISTKDRIGVANAMQSMDIGLFMIKPVFSKIASTPTKLGEFLGCGVPCFCNSGVGDVASIIRKRKVGVALDSFDEDEMRKGVQDMLDLSNCADIKERCRSAALKHFSLDDGVESYNEIYHSLSN